MDLDDTDVEIVEVSGQNLLTKVRIGIGIDLSDREEGDVLPNFVIMGISSRNSEGTEEEVVYGMSLRQFVLVLTKMAEFLSDQDVRGMLE